MGRRERTTVMHSLGQIIIMNERAHQQAEAARHAKKEIAVMKLKELQNRQLHVRIQYQAMTDPPSWLAASLNYPKLIASGDTPAAAIRRLTEQMEEFYSIHMPADWEQTS